MDASKIIFYILSAIIVGCGLVSVLSRKVLRAAVFLLFSMIGVAGLYFYLNYEFVAALQISVYVGGIVVLIIFSIFLTHDAGDDMKQTNLLRVALSVIVVLASAIGTLLLVRKHIFIASNKPALAITMKTIGRAMLSGTETGYLLPFEAVSFLLLAALIGCIVIAMKPKLKA